MTDKPEFSRLIAVEGITPDKIRTETIEATEEECVALAERFGICGVSDFRANIKIHRVAGGLVRLEGNLEAEVVQSCVVSLQDVHEEIKAAFETIFTEDASAFRDDEDLDFADGDEDAPELVVNGMIDLGEVTAQYLALELNPYPRAPGVSLAAQLAETGTDGKNRPFQVLENMQAGDKIKDKKGKKEK